MNDGSISGRDVLVPLALPVLFEIPPDWAVRRLDGRTMGTRWRVSFAAPPAADPIRLRPLIEAELDRVIDQMSPWEPASAVSRFNAAPAATRTALAADLFEVLAIADEIATASDGAFDPTRGELVDLWGFGPPIHWSDPGFESPSDARIERALARSGWQKLDLDGADRSAWQPGGMRLDLSAIAKGHAVDRVARRLSGAGISNHLVEIGGELRGTGLKPGGQPWWVAVDASEAVVALCGLAIATSGDAERWYTHRGRRVAHTIDPRTGRPLDNGLAAVTVIEPDCVRADALSTALMVLGDGVGPAWADARGIAACFRRRDGAALVTTTTRAWRAMLG